MVDLSIAMLNYQRVTLHSYLCHSVFHRKFTAPAILAPLAAHLILAEATISSRIPYAPCIICICIYIYIRVCVYYDVIGCNYVYNIYIYIYIFILYIYIYIIPSTWCTAPHLPTLPVLHNRLPRDGVDPKDDFLRHLPLEDEGFSVLFKENLRKTSPKMPKISQDGKWDVLKRGKWRLGW